MSKLRTVSWVVLALVGALVMLGALGSANLAYRGEFPLGGVSITEIASGREPVLLALRGARATAAAWAAGLGRPLPGGRARAVPARGRRGVVGDPGLGRRAGSRRRRACRLDRRPRGERGAARLLAIVVIALLLDVRRLSRAA